MTKAELHEQVDAMTDEEAEQARLVYAPDWPSKVTYIEEIGWSLRFWSGNEVT